MTTPQVLLYINMCHMPRVTLGPRIQTLPYHSAGEFGPGISLHPYDQQTPQRPVVLRWRPPSHLVPSLELPHAIAATHVHTQRAGAERKGCWIYVCCSLMLGHVPHKTIYPLREKSYFTVGGSIVTANSAHSVNSYWLLWTLRLDPCDDCTKGLLGATHASKCS